MRGFLLGLVVIVGMSLSILAIRPGGLRRQLQLAARRFRIVLVLAGIWLAASLVVRLAFPTGPVADYAAPALAIVLGAVFLFVGRDAAPAPPVPSGDHLPRP